MDFSGRPVSGLILQALPVTLGLLAKSVAFAFIPALFIGLVAGLQPGSVLDRLLMAPAVVLTAFPPSAAALVASVCSL